MIQFCNYITKATPGDEASCPALYFDIGQPSSRVDFSDYASGDVIFGGGGLICAGFGDPFQRALAQENVFKALWGCGLNMHLADSKAPITPELYPDWISRFDLVGLRDYGNPYRYIPDPSCMNFRFDSARRGRDEDLGIVVFEHHQYPVSIPRIMAGEWLRYPPTNQFTGTLWKLAAARVVVSTSFHGCYWAMLLGKPVVTPATELVRFKTFKHPPTFYEGDNWEWAVKSAPPTPDDYLDECRQLNLDFCQTVIKALADRPKS